MTDDAVEVVHALYAAYNGRDWDAALACLADDCEWANLATGWTYHRGAEVVQGMQRFTTAFPDLRVEITTVVHQDALVAFEWEGRGTLLGPLRRPEGWYPPTGQAFRQQGCCVAVVRDGCVVRCRDYFDGRTLLDQLGLAAVSPAPTAEDARDRVRRG